MKSHAVAVRSARGGFVPYRFAQTRAWAGEHLGNLRRAIPANTGVVFT